MKKTLALFICLCLFAFSAPALAHPPSNIKISFDKKTQNLNAVILHNTSSPQAHYIHKVDIGLNGKEIRTLTFKKQLNNTERTVGIPVPGVKAGDILSVEGYCNLSGKLQKEIKVS